MTLCEAVYIRMLNWIDAFKQNRTVMNAIRMAFSLLLNPSRNTITQGLVFSGLESQDWSLFYKLFSRSQWDKDDLFKPIIKETISSMENYICLAVDDTKIKKTGKNIPGTSILRDPISPPFHANLFNAHRVMQFTALIPLYKQIVPDPDDKDRLYNACRSVPVSFDNVPVIKKPGKRANEEELREYKRLKRQSNLSLAFIKRVVQLRIDYDEAGAKDKRILTVADGSFCNKTVFQAELDRTDIVARCRKDAKLCFKDTTSSKRFYSHDKFTPESVRQDESIKYQKTLAYIGKKLRVVTHLYHLPLKMPFFHPNFSPTFCQPSGQTILLNQQYIHS